MSAPATTPTPPYYAVIFTSTRSDGDNGYAEEAERILELARAKDGYGRFRVRICRVEREYGC